MKKSGVITAIVILGLVAGGIFLMSLSGKREEGAVAAAVHTNASRQGVAAGILAGDYTGLPTLVYDGPYISTSLHESGDNFLIEPPTDVTLAELADSEHPVTMLWFSAVWCEVCKRMRPYVAPTVNFYEKDISLKEINLDRNRKLVQGLGIFASPTFIVLDKQGFELFRYNVA